MENNKNGIIPPEEVPNNEPVFDPKTVQYYDPEQLKQQQQNSAAQNSQFFGNPMDGTVRYQQNGGGYNDPNLMYYQNAGQINVQQPNQGAGQQVNPQQYIQQPQYQQQYQQNYVDPDDNDPPKKRHTALKIIIALIVLAAIGAGVFFGISYLKKKQDDKSWQVKVPNVVKTDYTDAKDVLIKSKLHGLISDKIEDESVNEDSVLIQTPEADAKVSKGSIVDLVLSAGSEKAYLPDVSDYSFELAEKMITEAGFTIKKEEIESQGVAPGSVGEQSVKPGFRTKGQQVVVKVEPEKEILTETVAVPNITDKDIDAAKAELGKVGLYLSVNVAQYSDTVPENQIIKQDRAAGTNAKKGETVFVTVSLGFEKVYVPDVTYRTQQKAQSMLENLGFKYNVEHAESKTVAKDTVISQQPAVGEGVKEGSTVTITVSTGCEVTVPDVKGMKEEKAIVKILNSELAVRVEYKVDDSVDKGKVISQDYEAGEKIQFGTVVTIYVSGKEETDGGSEDATQTEIDPSDINALVTSCYWERTYVNADFDEIYKFNTDGTLTIYEKSDEGIKDITESGDRYEVDGDTLKIYFADELYAEMKYFKTDETKYKDRDFVTGDYIFYNVSWSTPGFTDGYPMYLQKSSYGASDGSVAVSTTKPTTTAAVTTTKPQFGNDWRGEYMKFLNDYLSQNGNPDEYIQFCLCYVDNDDVPELIISENVAHLNMAKVYTFYNGKMVDLGSVGPGYGTFRYIPKTGIILGGGESHGIDNTVLYRFQNGTIKEEHKLSAIYNPNDDSLTYTVDNADATETEYKEAMRKFGVDESRIKTNYDWNTGNRTGYVLNSSNINSIKTMTVK